MGDLLVFSRPGLPPQSLELRACPGQRVRLSCRDALFVLSLLQRLHVAINSVAGNATVSHGNEALLWLLPLLALHSVIWYRCLSSGIIIALSRKCPPRYLRFLPSYGVDGPNWLKLSFRGREDEVGKR